MEARQQIEAVVAMVRDIAENSDLRDVSVGVDITGVPAEVWAELGGDLIPRMNDPFKRLYSNGGCYVHAFRQTTPVAGARRIEKAVA